MSNPGLPISMERLREIIAMVVAEVTAAQARPGTLALFTGALLGFEDAVASLQRLVESGYVIDYVQTESAQRILDQELITSAGLKAPDPGLVRSHEVLVLPTMTVNLAAKVAHGIGDCLASNVTAEFIMSGKPVIASIAGVCPDSPEKQGWFPNMPAGYQAMLRRTLETLRGFGVHLTRPEKLDRAVAKALGQPTAAGPAAATIRCPLRLVHEASLAGFPDHAVVTLQPRAIVTAQAADAAARRGITLIRDETRN